MEGDGEFLRGQAVSYWLFKTEPESFSWEMQKKRGVKGEPWTGVRNFAAARIWQQNDPYAKAGLFATSDLRPWKATANNCGAQL